MNSKMLMILAAILVFILTGAASATADSISLTITDLDSKINDTYTKTATASSNDALLVFSGAIASSPQPDANQNHPDTWGDANWYISMSATSSYTDKSNKIAIDVNNVTSALSRESGSIKFDVTVSDLKNQVYNWSRFAWAVSSVSGAFSTDLYSMIKMGNIL
jgi:hypothetical protein